MYVFSICIFSLFTVPLSCCLSFPVVFSVYMSLSVLASWLNAFVLEHPPYGGSGIFSLNSFPFSLFQHRQLTEAEWGVSSCSCSLSFYILSLSLCFLLRFLLLSSQYASLFFLCLCHKHKLVLSVSQVLEDDIHRRQKMFLFLCAASVKWRFKLPLSSAFSLFSIFLFFCLFQQRQWPLTCFKVKEKSTRATKTHKN